MRGVAKLLVVMTILSALIGCESRAADPAPTFRDVQSREVLAKVGWQYYWSMPRPGFLKFGERLERLYMLGENLCYLTSLNRLVAYEANTGRVRWSVEVAAAGEAVFDPIFVNNMLLHETVPGLKTIVNPDTAPYGKAFDAVVVHTVYCVIVIDSRTGKIVRDENVGRFQDLTPAASGCADTRRFYGATAQGTCFAYELDAGTRIWIFGGYAGVRAPVREYAGQVFMANEAGELMAAMAEKERTLMWMQTLREPVIAPFHVSKRGLFVPGERGGIYAFEPIGGRAMWEQPFVCQGRLADPIQVSSRTVFQYAQGDTFYAIGLTDGKERWTLKDGRTVLGVLGDDVYVLDARRVLHVVDEITGKENWALPLTGMEVFLPNTSAEGIWAATRDGRVYCLRPMSAGRLTIDKLGNPN